MFLFNKKNEMNKISKGDLDTKQVNQSGNIEKNI
jgi:hypothetical protein